LNDDRPPLMASPYLSELLATDKYAHATQLALKDASSRPSIAC